MSRPAHETLRQAASALVVKRAQELVAGLRRGEKVQATPLAEAVDLLRLIENPAQATPARVNVVIKGASDEG